MRSCYSCYPSRFVRRHVTHETDEFVFGYDMWGRPLIIVTPRRHYHAITEMSAELLERMFAEIKQWLCANDICGHQTQLHWNSDAWQTHHHFHVKLRIDEERYRVMRKRHFDSIDRQRGQSQARRRPPQPIATTTTAAWRCWRNTAASLCWRRAHACGGDDEIKTTPTTCSNQDQRR